MGRDFHSTIEFNTSTGEEQMNDLSVAPKSLSTVMFLGSQKCELRTHKMAGQQQDCIDESTWFYMKPLYNARAQFIQNIMTSRYYNIDIKQVGFTSAVYFEWKHFCQHFTAAVYTEKKK